MNWHKLILGLPLCIALNVHAGESGPEQKLVLVKGEYSYLMQGDSYRFAHNKPQGYSKKSVLPALLSSGWTIKSVHVNEKSREDHLYGYVVLERQP